MKKKRVACFYRVSTKRQVIEDDIPLQRNACLEFISHHPDWVFEKEYVEKGVSGFKVKAADREKLEELKDDALKNEFDIILCFMFDRIGRIEEETPYVVKWFIEQDIEVWSVKEGQRTLENHVDNLLNYITFWQAAGESKKTQQRTLEAKQQMRESNRYLGGSAAFGYKHISTGEHNEKGRELKKLVIDEEEAEIIRNIFDLSTIKGYGSRRIAKELNDLGVLTKKGKNWAGGTVMGILKNSLYKGYFTYNRNAAHKGKRIYRNQYECEISELKHDDLSIISEKQWDEVQKIITSRAGKLKSNIPKQTNSPLLFIGFSYCGICGSRLMLHYSYTHYKRKDGSMSPKTRKPFYECYGVLHGLCDGKNKAYAKDRVERAVLNQVYMSLDKIEQMDLSKEYIKNRQKKIKNQELELKNKKEAIIKIENDIGLLKKEILKIIKGESLFTPELLNEQIVLKENELNQNINELKALEEIINIKKANVDDYLSLTQTLLTWRETFEKADVDTKKMLLTKIIEWIKVDRDNIQIKWSVTIEELLGYDPINVYNV